MNEVIDSCGARFMVIVRIPFRDKSSGIAIISYFEGKIMQYFID